MKPRSISDRLKASRRAKKISQGRLAAEINLSRDQLASVETGRVPLRFWPAWNACRFLNINPRWLASGKGRQAPFVFYGFDPEERELLTEQTSFEKGFSPIEDRYRVEWLVQGGFAKERAAIAINSAESQVELDRVLNLFSNGPVLDDEESRWGALVERLRIATASFGAKARLARYLGVKRQAVTQWLSGKTSPTAETVLRLIEWVAIAEKKKRAGRAETRPTQETRKGKIKENEKTKSDQKKM